MYVCMYAGRIRANPQAEAIPSMSVRLLTTKFLQHIPKEITLLDQLHSEQKMVTIYICMYVYVYMYVCMCVCVCICMYVCMNKCVYVRELIRMKLKKKIIYFRFVNWYMYVCMYVCNVMYVCMYVWYVSMYLIAFSPLYWTYTHTLRWFYYHPPLMMMMMIRYVYACMYVWMYAMYVCLYVCMYVCMYRNPSIHQYLLTRVYAIT